MATTADYLNELVTQKKALADNLVTKGVEATEDETFNTLVPKVLDITTGGGSSEKVKFPFKSTSAITANTPYNFTITDLGYYIQKIDDGHVYKVTYSGTSTYTYSFYLCDFDKNTGAITNDILITTTTGYNLAGTQAGIVRNYDSIHGCKTMVFACGINSSTYYNSSYSGVKLIIITVDESFNPTFAIKTINNPGYRYCSSNNWSTYAPQNLKVYRDSKYIYIIYAIKTTSTSYGYPTCSVVIVDLSGNIVKSYNKEFSKYGDYYVAEAGLCRTDEYVYIYMDLRGTSSGYSTYLESHIFNFNDSTDISYTNTFAYGTDISSYKIGSISCANENSLSQYWTARGTMPVTIDNKIYNGYTIISIPSSPSSIDEFISSVNKSYGYYPEDIDYCLITQTGAPAYTRLCYNYKNNNMTCITNLYDATNGNYTDYYCDGGVLVTQFGKALSLTEHTYSSAYFWFYSFNSDLAASTNTILEI